MGGIIVLWLLGACCYAQDDGRPGCSAVLDEAKFGKPRPPAKQYTVAVNWRPAASGIEVLARLTGGTEAPQDWLPAGFGWVAIDYTANLYYRVTYGPGAGYTLDVMIPDLGAAGCTWR